MANIYYGVTSPSLNLDVQMELSDADSQRIMTYLVAGSPYGTVTENVQSQVPNPAWSPDQPDPLDPPEYIDVQAWVTRQATPEEAAKAYATAVMNSLLADTLAWEKVQAGTDAANNVPPITPVAPPHDAPPTE